MRGGLQALSVIVAVTVSCVVPAPFDVIVPDVHWMGICQCEVCEGGTCTLAKERRVFECGNENLETDAPESLKSVLLAHCRASEDLADPDDPNAVLTLGECTLRPIDDAGDFFIVPDPFDTRSPIGTPPEDVVEGVCPGDELSDSALLLHGSTPDEAVVTIDPDIDESSIEVIAPDARGIFQVRGLVAFRGANCTTGSCPIQLNWASLRPRELRFRMTDGTDVDVVRARGFLALKAQGTFFPSAGGGEIMFGSNAVRMIMSGQVVGHDERRGIDASNQGSTNGGSVSYADRRFRIHTTLTSGDTIIRLDLSGTVDNFAPHVELPASHSVECSQTGGARVVVPASVEDVDNTGPLRFLWFVDGEPAFQNSPTLDTFLALGTHRIDLVVFDAEGGRGHSTTKITVRDTTPPQVSVEPICLWPPNHRYFLLRASDLSVAITDSCDPNPTVEFVDATSSQPDDGSGDGNTSQDVRLSADALCVRAERSGGDPDGRRYTVQVRASDANGNATLQSSTIRVGHDQGGASRCDSRVMATPAPTAEVCEALPVIAAQGENRHAGAGCSVKPDRANPVSVVPGLLTLLALLLGWAIRRRSPRLRR